MLWFITAARLVWESVGKKLSVLPAALAATAYHLRLLPGQEIVAGPVVIPVSGIIAVAIIMIWLITGLLIKAVRLQMTADLDPTPDMPGREVFQHVMLHSKWASGREPDGGALYNAVDREIGKEAHLGKLRVWAERRPAMKGGSPVRTRELCPKEWADLHFDYPTCISNAPEGALLTDLCGTNVIIYENVCMNRRQVCNIWPKANLFDRLRDGTREKRREFFKLEQSPLPNAPSLRYEAVC